jgi:hypothetical protein
MTTIFDSARSVKTARRFGTLPARERRMPYTGAPHETDDKAR